MSKKKPNGRLLTFNQLPTSVYRQTEIDVPEFGDDMQVIVRELTVRDKQILSSQMFGGTMNNAAAPIIVALTTIDTKGNLVFGRSRQEAIERVSGLPESYLPAVLRIAQTAIHLTSGKPMDDMEAVDEAEKN